jgi:hypothetical protein
VKPDAEMTVKQRFSARKPYDKCLIGNVILFLQFIGPTVDTHAIKGAAKEGKVGA